MMNMKGFFPLLFEIQTGSFLSICAFLHSMPNSSWKALPTDLRTV